MTAYLFLEFAALAFFVAVCWDRRRFSDLARLAFWRPAMVLATCLFVLDELAVRLGLWAFPSGGTLPIRVGSIPLEELLAFIIHTIVCALLLQTIRARRR